MYSSSVGEEYFLARYTSIANPPPYFRLVAVDGGTVDMAISLAQGDLDGALDFVWCSLPGAEANGGDLRAGVQGEMYGKGHVVVFRIF